MFGKKRNVSQEETPELAGGTEGFATENEEMRYDSDFGGQSDYYFGDEYDAGAEAADTDDMEYEDEYYGGDDEYDGDDEYYDEDDEYYDDEERPRSVGRTIAYMMAVLAASVVIALGMWFAADDVLALTKPDEVINIVINEGDSLDAVAQNLKDHGLVNYKFLFVLYGKLSNAEEKFSAGTYELNQQFDYHALVNSLAASSETRKTVTVTFPEGYTSAKTFELLEENGVCSVEELEQTAANYEFEYEFLADRPYGDANRLEGYLFPDTYEFYVDDDPERVINKFLKNFNNKFTEEMIAAIENRNTDIRQRMEEEGSFTAEEIENAMLDVYKVITIASLIEKEAGNDSERTTIASVIYNRLTTRVHELLQIDATVEYALGDHEGDLTANDLAVDDPYNTYKYKGLPPGPIASPGLASIMAALYPEDTEYFFYALETYNSHKFFNTYVEHREFLTGESSDEPEVTEEVPEEVPAETTEEVPEEGAEEGTEPTGEETEDAA